MKLVLISYSTQLLQKLKEQDYYQSPWRVLQIGFTLFQFLLLAYISDASTHSLLQPFASLMNAFAVKWLNQMEDTA